MAQPLLHLYDTRFACETNSTPSRSERHAKAKYFVLPQPHYDSLSEQRHIAPINFAISLPNWREGNASWGSRDT
jgi:hypothetical protein